MINVEYIIAKTELHSCKKREENLVCVCVCVKLDIGVTSYALIFDSGDDVTYAR